MKFEYGFCGSEEGIVGFFFAAAEHEQMRRQKGVGIMPTITIWYRLIFGESLLTLQSTYPIRIGETIVVPDDPSDEEVTNVRPNTPSMIPPGKYEVAGIEYILPMRVYAVNIKHTDLILKKLAG